MLVSKNRVIRRRAVVGLLVLAALALLSLSYRQGSTGMVGDIQRGTSSMTAPFTTAAHRITQPFVDAWDWTGGLIDARNQSSQLERLRQDYSSLYAQNQALKQTNAHLTQLLRFKDTATVAKRFPYVGASVIQQSTSAYDGTVVIDAGADRAIRPNDPVVAPTDKGGGLIGVVTACTGSTCNVRLITDQGIGSGVTSQVLDTTARGSLVPSSGDPGVLSLELVPNSIPLRVGETVITAGTRNERLQALLPPGIPIGRISSVETTDTTAGFHTIQVTPFVDFGNLSSVLVLEVRGHG
jgi:rod shape-determining protein MreC